MTRLRLVHDMDNPARVGVPDKAAGRTAGKAPDRGAIPVDPDRFPCYAADTIIATDQEDLPVQFLKPGDRVLSPDVGFDLVLRTLRLPMDLSAQAVCRVFRARSAGNFADLHVSKACRVYSAGMEALPNSGSARSAPTNRHWSAQGGEAIRLYCLILQRGRLIVANGALASVANGADLMRRARRGTPLHQGF